MSRLQKTRFMLTGTFDPLFLFIELNRCYYYWLYIFSLFFIVIKPQSLDIQYSNKGKIFIVIPKSCTQIVINRFRGTLRE